MHHPTTKLGDMNVSVKIINLDADAFLFLLGL